MIKARLLFYLSALLVFPLSSSASGITAVGKIESLNIGNVVQIGINITSNPDNCADLDFYILEKAGNDKFEEVFAGLLLAKGQNSDVKFFVDGCVNNQANTKNRPSVFSVIVLD